MQTDAGELAPSRRGGATSPAGMFAAAVALLLGVLFSPLTGAPFWTARAALLLSVAAVGLPLLVRLLRSGARGPAAAALALVAVAALSTAVSPGPLLALTGLYNWGTGLLFVGAVAGAWALGAAVPGREVPLLERALVATVAVNGIVAIAQVAFDLGVEELKLVGARPPALLGNPVQVGALMAGGVVLGGMRAWRRPAAGAAFVGLAAAALQLSGSRFALATGAAGAVAVAARLGRTRGAALLVAAALGIAAGQGVAEIGGGESGAERVIATTSGSAGGITPRLETWWSARHALADRPILGAGPGRFRAATSRYRTLRAARAEGPDTLFADAHNVAVEYAVTTGVAGLAALGAWLALASRGTAGPLLGFALALGALHLVQPQAEDVTPLAALAFGAARPRLLLRRARSPARWATGALLAAALAAGAALLVGDFRLDQAVLDFELDDAEAARTLLAPWPEPLEITARIHAFRWITTDDPAELDRARRWSERAAALDPTDPKGWVQLAEIELRLGRLGDARRHFLEALEHNPWSARAIAGLARAAGASGDGEEARRWLERLARVDPGLDVDGEPTDPPPPDELQSAGNAERGRHGRPLPGTQGS